MTELDARIYVACVRGFYRDLLVYGVVNFLFILIWLFMGAGYFWPFWVILGWGGGLAFQAFSLGLIPKLEQFHKHFPFLSKQWEDQQIEELTKPSEKVVKPSSPKK